MRISSTDSLLPNEIFKGSAVSVVKLFTHRAQHQSWRHIHSLPLLLGVELSTRRNLALSEHYSPSYTLCVLQQRLPATPLVVPTSREFNIHHRKKRREKLYFCHLNNGPRCVHRLKPTSKEKWNERVYVSINETWRPARLVSHLHARRILLHSHLDGKATQPFWLHNTTRAAQEGLCKDAEREWMN